ncbi:polycystic kidney disease protein 1-like 1, partial [Plakobranchus ocellatus]
MWFSARMVILGLPQHGAPLYREDLIFSFQFPGEPPHLTQVPVVTRQLHRNHPNHSQSSAPSPPSKSLSTLSSPRAAFISSIAQSVPESSAQLVRTESLSQGSTGSLAGDEHTRGRGGSRTRENRRETGQKEEEEKVRGISGRGSEVIPPQGKIPTGGYSTSRSAGGTGGIAAGRKRIWSRPRFGPSAHPTHDAGVEGARKVGIDDDGGTRLGRQSVQTNLSVQISVANEVGKIATSLILTYDGFWVELKDGGARQQKENNLKSRKLRRTTLLHPVFVKVQENSEFVLR